MIAALLVLALPVSCASGDRHDPAETSRPLPPTLAVEVLQLRSDYATGGLQVRIANTSREPVVVTSARVAAPSFEGDVVWAGESVVPAGAVRDLRTALPTMRCDAEPGAPVAEIVLQGAAAPFEGPVGDPFGTVARILDEACFAQEVGSRLVVTLDDELLRGAAPADPAAITGSLRATGEHPVRVVRVADTVLLASAHGGEGWELDATVDPGESVPLSLPVVPARCDPHAVAEDKVGTLLPFEIEIEIAEGETGTLTVAAGDRLRDELYTFIGEHCGWR